MDQYYVIICFRLPAGCNSMYAMSISVPNSVGTAQVNYYDDATGLRQTFGRFGLSADQQNQIVNSVSNQKLMVMSLVSIPDNLAEDFGIELHDGDKPMEPNQIQLTKSAQTGGELAVTIMVNDQIMPAAVRGVYQWAKVHDCLLQSGYFTEAAIQGLEQQVEQTGTATGKWTGISTAIVTGLGQPSSIGQPSSPSPVSPTELTAVVR